MVVERSPGPPSKLAQLPSARCCERIHAAAPRARSSSRIPRNSRSRRSSASIETLVCSSPRQWPSGCCSASRWSRARTHAAASFSFCETDNPGVITSSAGAIARLGIPPPRGSQGDRQQPLPPPERALRFSHYDHTVESLRLDARRNRSRIVRAARLSFAERGLGIAVHLIADRAGVGMGTLYRHFPSKQSLIDAALAQRLDELQPSIDGALSAADPWDGFAELLLAMVAAQVQDRGFSQMLGPGGTGAISDQLRVRLLRPLERLMLQAQAAGRMRADLIAG